MNLTESATFCSSCHCQHEDTEYVDFNAYWDGPTLDGDIKIPIDDLIICKECLKAAGLLIGLVDKKEMRKENFQLGRAVEEKNQEIEELRKAVSNLEYTLKQSLDGKIKRGQGRPRIFMPGEAEEVTA